MKNKVLFTTYMLFLIVGLVRCMRTGRDKRGRGRRGRIIVGMSNRICKECSLSRSRMIRVRRKSFCGHIQVRSKGTCVRRTSYPSKCYRRRKGVGGQARAVIYLPRGLIMRVRRIRGSSSSRDRGRSLPSAVSGWVGYSAMGRGM